MKFINSALKSKTVTLILILVVMIVFFEIISGGGILRPLNIRNILQSITIVSLLTIGAGTLMISGEIDLSLGGIGTLCAVLAAQFLNMDLPWLVAFIVPIIVGGFIGMFNAFLVNELRFQSFIATLATASITQGAGFLISGGVGLPINHPVFRFIGTERIFDFVPWQLLISVAALLIYGFVLHRTKFGRSVYLIGGNRVAARLAGIRPKRISYSLFINAGALSALAGVLLASRLLVANTVGITSSQFAGLTAAILGGISFGGGTGGLGGAFIGILILNCFNNGMAVVNVPPYWQTVASGALLLVALTIDFMNIRRRNRLELKGGE